MNKIIIFILLCTGFQIHSFTRISPFGGGVNATYNQVSGLEISLTIEIFHFDDPTDYFITISGGLNGVPANRLFMNPNNDPIEYFLYNNMTDKIIIKDLSSNPSLNEVLSGSLPNGNTRQNVTYYLSIPSGAFYPGSTYTDTVTVSLYKGNLNSYTFSDSRDLTFNIQVPDVIDISLVPLGANFDVNSSNMTFDFGELFPGQTKNADIIVRSNLSYEVSLSSENGSILKSMDPANTSEIPYLCSINGSTITLPPLTPTVVIQGSPTNNEGDRNRIDIVIGNFWDVGSGTYEDNITITLAAL